jgi:hypothetical protein
MVGGEEGEPIPEAETGSVAKTGPGPWESDSSLMTGLEKSVEGDPTEGDHDADPAEQPELLHKIAPAVGELLARRFILRRGTPKRRGNIAVPQLQAIPPGDGGRLIGKAEGA